MVAYTTPFCPDCIRARQFFQKNGIQYLEVNIYSDVRAASFVAGVNHGCRSVPTIVFPNGEVLVEPSLDELARKFAAA
ncbi:MAG: NrdH-redoxin [Anaerolineales bacterium]|nr:NrdH-redoxin [Anaerolineales bacterium]